MANWLALILCPVALGQESWKLRPGLAVSFTSEDGKASDVIAIPNMWLFASSGKSPTPFLPAGKFIAVWNGVLQLDLRSEYAFQAELNGELKLELNGKTLLEANGITGSQLEAMLESLEGVFDPRRMREGQAWRIDRATPEPVSHFRAIDRCASRR